MIVPTQEQILAAETWTDLYKSMGLNPRNTRKCDPVRNWVKKEYPEFKLEKTKKFHGKFTDDEFTALVMQCQSVRQVIDKGGWTLGGSAYTMIHDRIRKLKIDNSHFKGQAIHRGTTKAPKREISEYLVQDSFSIKSHSLKLRLIKEGLKQHQCEMCHLTEWLGEPIPITLDHINGDHFDNRLDNLRILCPNCHAKTPTFGAKNRKYKVQLPPCPICNTPVKAKRRITCGSNNCMKAYSLIKHGGSGGTCTHKGPMV